VCHLLSSALVRTPRSLIRYNFDEMSRSSEWLLFFPVFFVAMWASVLWLISLISGWAVLGKRFRHSRHFYDEMWGFRSAKMRFNVHYGNCLSVGADKSGLYLSVFSIFRIGHPPLLIPWTQISVLRGESGLIFKKRELHLGRDESIPFRISKSLALKIQEAAGDAWPVETIGA
jgi:hypothetical protein